MIIKYTEYKEFIRRKKIIENAISDDRFDNISRAVGNNNLKEVLKNINSIIETIETDIKNVNIDNIEYDYDKYNDCYQFIFSLTIDRYIMNLLHELRKLKEDDKDYIFNNINDSSPIEFPVDIEIHKENFNKIDIPIGLPKFMKGYGLGKLMYITLINKLNYISSSDFKDEHGHSTESDFVWSSLLKNNELYSFTKDNNFIIFNSNYDYNNIIKVLKKYYNDTNLDRIREQLNDIIVQKDSQKYNL